MRIVHIADVHWRGLSRHDEYRRSFSDFFEKTEKLKPDVIYVGGDIVHSKTQGISPELIDCLSWWFTEMAKVAPVHVILGNHDGLILNEQRQDAISPILAALNNPRIHLYKKSGVYPIGDSGFNWCVFSCFDEKNWENVKPVPGDVNIALYHGGVIGSLTDINWEIEGEIKADFFKGYDFALLGDIHKYQFLNEEKTIAYCGSTIQQNYGEDPGKGFLLWDIKSKNDFTSEFHEVYHDKPFVTIDWKGDVENTLKEAHDYPQGARFRIKADCLLQQADMKLLGARLKAQKNASEIVYKVDKKVETGLIEANKSLIEKKSLRDSGLQKELMRTYHQNAGLTKAEWSKFDDLVTRFTNDACRQDSSVRNSRWLIKRVEFDNTFGYGKGNVIDFEKLNGITGIFGKNRSGKSSIIGTLMYVFFNTTDRGAIKNEHIINSRKGHCRVNAWFSVDSINYRVERFTIKKQNRKGMTSATTGLNLFKTDSEGNDIEDLSGEQRRETEKILRALIGGANDFLLTSLAPQGDMNTFIKERATSRKMILSKFLDLDIFDKMYELGKEESTPLKTLAKSAPEIDYDSEIKRIRETLRRRKNKIGNVEEDIRKNRNILQEFKIKLATSSNPDIVSHADLQDQKEVVKDLSALIVENGKNKKSVLAEIDKLKLKIQMTEQVMKRFPIEEINKQIQEFSDIQKNLVDMTHQLEKEKILLKNQESELKKLDLVPCGTSFPTCMFIKDSVSVKQLIPSQQEKIKSIKKVVGTVKRAITRIEKQELQEQKRKHEALDKRLNEVKVEVSNKKIVLYDLSAKLEISEKRLLEEKLKLSKMEVNVVDDSTNDASIKLKNKIRELSEKISTLDSDRLSLAEQIGHNEVHLKNLKEDKQKYNGIKKELKLYDMFLQAVSKKGIPRQIISSQLPLINIEITKILQGITGFTVELEADPDSNSMDIFINYGDSKRIIELASGMEKMMASLAIRVALINISSLPKTDMLIIDEGFGALDETNIEACNTLLDSLKKWFRNIIIISHIDAVKDSVDNVIDISSSENNSLVRYV